MTTQDEIEALIKRLEEAAEGNAEFDRAICRALTGDETEWRPYTRSVDAALTLVPEGWRVVSILRAWSKREWDIRLCGPRFDKTREVLGELYTGDGAHSVHLDLALVLCIAALRARLSDMKDDANDA